MGLASISGAVLAGGRSSRFGRDKALEVYGGLSLLERAVRALDGCAERFVVGGTPERYGFLGLPVVPDPAPGLGPLAGLTAALERSLFERVAVTACDMPGLSPAFWAYLAGFEPADLVIPQGPHSLEPLAAIYGRTCLEPVRAALAASCLKLTGWHEELTAGGLTLAIVPWASLEPRFGEGVFRNVNRPADLEALEVGRSGGELTGRG